MFENEEMIRIADAAAIVPGRPKSAVVWRWARFGLRARSGELLHLECVRVGGRLYTSVGAVHRFLSQLTQADQVHFDRPRAAPSPRPRGQTRRKSIERARRRLDKAGV